MTLGEKLQLLRRSRGLSQEQLAAELDVSRQAISKWECGDSTPDLDMLRAMRGHVRHLHVLDWTADGKLCLPGRGVFDWQQFARVLREDGFDGAVILEPYAQLVESEQALLESIRFLRGVFGAPAQM